VTAASNRTYADTATSKFKHQIGGTVMNRNAVAWKV